jgi:hypothetical protein
MFNTLHLMFEQQYTSWAGGDLVAGGPRLGHPAPGSYGGSPGCPR